MVDNTVHPIHKHVDGTQTSDYVAPPIASTPDPMMQDPMNQMGGGYGGGGYGGGYGTRQIGGFSVKPIESPDAKEPWFKIWHVAIAWTYIAICLFDFIIFPGLSMFLPAIMHLFGVSVPYTAWVSLTLSNGGLLHAAFGAILGVSAWQRFSDSRENF